MPATLRQFGLYSLGNSTWDVLFAEVMPRAARHIKRVLGLQGRPHTVEFGHNSHELVMRVLSTKLGELMLSLPTDVANPARLKVCRPADQHPYPHSVGLTDCHDALFLVLTGADHRHGVLLVDQTAQPLRGDEVGPDRNRVRAD
eukprot:COSAG01_NODE_4322_length_5133_cov_8.546285_4_plen_144_part_00